MNCQEALALLYDIIDKEASEIDAAEVKAHLEKCHDCFQKYHLEGAVNSLVTERLKSVEPTRCTVKLRDKIISQLDDIDSELPQVSPKSRRFPFGNSALVLAVAATVVVAVGGFFVFKGITDNHAPFAPLEQAHWNSTALVTHAATNSTAESEAVQFAHAEQVNLSESYDGFSVVAANIDTVMNTPMSHYVYRKGETLVSVFVAPASFEIPSALEATAVTVNGVKMFDHNCRGCRLVYHRAGNAVIVTATTEKEIDLVKFNPGQGTI